MVNRIYYLMSIELVVDPSNGLNVYEVVYTNGIAVMTKYFDSYELSHIPTQIIEHDETIN